jgi:hypothetical protein
MMDGVCQRQPRRRCEPLGRTALPAPRRALGEFLLAVTTEPGQIS